MPPRRRLLRRCSSARRLQVTLVAIGVVLSAFAGRLVQLQGLDAARYRTLASNEHTGTLYIPAVRGAITTSDGTVLAMTVQTDQVYADPPLIPQSMLAGVAAKLAGPLRMTPAAIAGLLTDPHRASLDYVPLRPAVSALTAARIAALGLPGIGMKATYTRSYPNGSLAAGVLGFTDLRHGTLTGEAGLELADNSVLSGRAGKQAVEVGASGEPIPGTQTTVRQLVPAGSVRLTLQSAIQWDAESECMQRVLQTHARSCSIIVMQPGTGRILAMAQYPTYSPAAPASLTGTTDIGAADVFAPGSTAKVITAAAAFEHGGQTPASSYTVPDRIMINGRWLFHDAEYHPTQRYTIAGIIAYSLNDGMVQVAAHVTPQQQYAEFRAFGIGSPSGLRLPGESSGILPAPASWYGNERYLLSFGQGVDVTAVQMASVYATIANGGVRVQPSLVAGVTSSTGAYRAAPAPSRHRVLPRRIAAELMGILEQVPQVDAKGAEPWGLIPGYTVAAKTGTAQEPDKTYGSSFIGIAPATDPKLVVAVNIQDPTHGYFGIQVAGPAFYKVMEFALQTMKIPQDYGRTPHVPLTVP